MDDKEILEIFKESPDPAMFTAEVSEVLGFSQTGTQKRLESLVDDGFLDKKQPKQTVIWWLTDEGKKVVN